MGHGYQMQYAWAVAESIGDCPGRSAFRDD